jgi:hypothetical protein
MIQFLQKFLVALTKSAEEHAFAKQLRRMAAAFRAASPKNIAKTIRGMQDLYDRLEAMGKNCVSLEQFEKSGGRFDSADIRYWLSLAQRAGVPFIPAREILVLTQEEAELVSGSVDLSKTPLGKVSKEKSNEILKELGVDPNREPSPAPASSIDREALIERIFAAMDDVPEGYMVRHVRAGPSTLKTLAGAGVAPPNAEPVNFGSNHEVGPGYIRHGNRRRVHVNDDRIVKVAMVQAPDGPQRFVARPWMKGARYLICDDPHRHGTKFAGKGAWPAEWRTFVHNGKVEAVSAYYAWAGTKTAKDARMALEVRELAQRIVDAGLKLNAVPLHVEHEMHRNSEHEPAWLRNDYPVDAFACTLDFIETTQGLMLLEGGPCWSPAQVAHPCGFVGTTGRPQGVAFHLMAGVSLMEPSTWKETIKSEAILDWAQVEALAKNQ